MLGMFATPVTCTPVPTRPGRSGHCCLHWLARRGSSCHLSPLGAQEQQSSSPFWRLRTGQVPAGWADFSVSSQALNPSWGPYPHDLITPPKAHLPTPSPQGSGLRLWSVSVYVCQRDRYFQAPSSCSGKWFQFLVNLNYTGHVTQQCHSLRKGTLSEQPCPRVQGSLLQSLRGLGPGARRQTH